MTTKRVYRRNPRPGEVWYELRRRGGRRYRREVLILEVDATHAHVRNLRTDRKSWIILTEFTHNVMDGWRPRIDTLVEETQ